LQLRPLLLLLLWCDLLWLCLLLWMWARRRKRPWQMLRRLLRVLLHDHDLWMLLLLRLVLVLLKRLLRVLSWLRRHLQRQKEKRGESHNVTRDNNNNSSKFTRNRKQQTFY
jgi:hypothetical protein